MKKTIRTLAAAMTLFAVAALPIVAQSDAHAVLRSRDGVVVVWNESDAHFTIEIPGKTILPSNVGGLAMLVDGWHLQVVVSDPSEYGQGLLGGELLWSHAKWEAEHWSTLAGVKMKPSPIAAEGSLPPEFRLWEIRWPDDATKERKIKSKTDLFSSTLVGDRIVALNLTVMEDQDEALAQKLLAHLSATLYRRAGMIPIAEVQQALENEG